MEGKEGRSYYTVDACGCSLKGTLGPAIADNLVRPFNSVKELEEAFEKILAEALQNHTCPTKA